MVIQQAVSPVIPCSEFQFYMQAGNYLFFWVFPPIIIRKNIFSSIQSISRYELNIQKHDDSTSFIVF